MLLASAIFGLFIDLYILVLPIAATCLLQMEMHRKTGALVIFMAEML